MSDHGLEDRIEILKTAPCPTYGNRQQLHYCISVIGKISGSAYSVHRLKISDPLVPPKPKELESAMFIDAFRAWLGT